MMRTSASAGLVIALLTTACGESSSQLSADSEPAEFSGSCANGTRWLPQLAPSQANQRVLAFAKSSLNRTVGAGECADLAQSAIAAAHGKPFYQLGPTGQNADYVWGDLRYTTSTGNRLAPPQVVTPGEVIQFRNANFKWYPTPNSWQTTNAQHHTAIVSQVSVDGKSLCVLEQNSGGKRYVSYGYYPVSGLQSGTMRYFAARL